MACECPLTDQSPDLENVTCPEGGGQISKHAFQPLLADYFTTTGTAPATDIDSQTAWTTAIALTANDPQRVQVTPIFVDGDISDASLIERSGDNSTYKGQTVTDGKGSVDVTGSYDNLPSAAYKKLAVYNCLSSASGVFIFTPSGIWCGEDVGGFHNALPIGSYNINSRSGGQFGAPDKNTFKFSMSGDWQDNAVFVKTDWDPTSLLN